MVMRMRSNRGAGLVVGTGVLLVSIGCLGLFRLTQASGLALRSEDVSMPGSVQ